jgi:hypothetical protein
MAAAKMRTENAANDRSGAEEDAQRRDGMDCCKIAGKSSDRVYQDEQRRNGGRLANMRPSAEERSGVKIFRRRPVNPKGIKPAPTLMAVGWDG